MIEYCIVAGVAAKDQSKLRAFLKENGRGSSRIDFLTVAERNPAYKESVIEGLLGSIAKTVSRLKPNIIRVIYVPYRRSEFIQELFFPFADIKPLDNGKCYDEYVLKYYKNIEEVGGKILEILRGGLRLKKRPSKKHCVLLPINNFYVNGSTFAELLRRYCFENVDDLIFNCIAENNTHHCYEDSRNIIFPVTRVNEGELKFKEGEVNPKHFLSGIFRLGFSVDAGFHFDVTHARKPTLNGYRFNCSINGVFLSRGNGYLNIYLNDFIRVPK